VSDFFEPPPPLEDPERAEPRPPWWHAPSGTLPGVIALELVVARTERVVVCVARLGAYPTGFELDLVTIASGESDELDPFLFGQGLRGRTRRRESQAAAGIPPEKLRFGIEFADGTKATNTSRSLGRPLEEPPTGPLLTSGGGSGGGGNFRQSIWVWPLPPAGKLAFVCEWPVAGIPLTRQEIDAQPILDAASRAQQFFTEAELSNTPGGHAITIGDRPPS
jgi:hypothetical protein